MRQACINGTATLVGGLLTFTAGAGDLGQLVFPNPEFPTGDLPMSLRLADLNGDGALDVVTADSGFSLSGFHPGTTVSVLLNSGDGTLAPPVALQVGTGPVELRLGDLDGDGDVDIVAANAETDNATILLNQLNPGGDGVTYIASSVFAGPDPFGMDLGDLDGDGDLDMAVTSLDTGQANGPVLLAFNDGAGGFTAGATLFAGYKPSSVAIGDVNGDGANDIVVGSFGIFGSGSLQVFLNYGKAGFDLLANISADSGDNEGPASVEIADLDGDGNPDLVVGQAAGFPSSGRVSLFFGLGDGGFGPEVPLPTDWAIPAISVNVTEARALDLDGDDDLDIAAAFSGISVAAVYINQQPDNHFSGPTFVQTGVGPESLDAADMDGDGVVELVVANGSDNVSVLRGLGGGDFGADLPFSLGNASERGAIMTDVDGDSILDLLIATGQTQGAVAILFGNGEGGYDEQLLVPVGVGFARDVVAADLDGDGDLDLATVGNSGVFNGQFPLSGVSIRLNLSGAFPSETVIALESLMTALVGHDFDSDGDVDLALIAGAPDGAVQLLLNQSELPGGDATFIAGASVPISGPTFDVFIENSEDTFVALADLNGDGHADLAILPSDGSGGDPENQVVILLGHGDGTFDEPLVAPVPLHSRTLAVAHLNGDRVLDIVVGNRGVLQSTQPPVENDVAVIFGNGDGTFSEPTPFETGPAPRAVAAADFNGDGHTDIAAANDPSNMSVLLSDGRGGFSESGRFGIGYGPRQLITADTDGDGDHDVVVTQTNSHSVSVLLNQLDVAAPISADLDGDGDVDAADLAILLGSWSIPPGTPGCDGQEPCEADFNRDGAVSAADLALLLGAWGPCS